jgi:glycosyltransferase involved in cell wall biosynthesis
LLSLQQQGLVSKFSKEVESIELPWTNDLNNLGLFYEAADLFLMPSVESFGMMTLEAMSSGVPVVTLHKTASSEVAKCPELEVVFDDLIGSLAQKITWAIDNRSKLNEIRNQGISRATDHFSLRTYLQNLKTMYEQVAGAQSI